ncbi:MAG: PAS domain-containing protein [Elusimicrobia bacterium]|nr:PAS domain-containing protein [Elusimicrobiota bacterium]
MNRFQSPSQDAGGKTPDQLGAEFVLELGRAVKVVSLYYANHPTALQTLRQVHAILERLLTGLSAGRVTFSLAAGRWLRDGSPLPAPGPGADSLLGVFETHSIESLTFLGGIRPFELVALAEVAASVPTRPGRAALQEFLQQRGVTHIKADIEHYSKESAPQGSDGSLASGLPAASSSAAKPPVAPSVLRPAAPAPAGKPSAPASAAKPSAPAPAGKPSSPAPAAKPSAPAPAGKPSSPAPAAKPSAPASAAKLAAPSPSVAHSVPAQPPKPALPPVEVRASAAGMWGPPSSPAPDSHGDRLGVSFGSVLRKLVETAVQDPDERSHIYEDVVAMVKETLDRHVDQATQALSEEKARIVRQAARTERVLTTVADGKFTVDKEGRVLMMNASAEMITGKRLADLAGKHITEGVKEGEHMVALAEDLASPAVDGAGVTVVADEAVGGAMRRSLALVRDDAGRVVGTYASLPDAAKFKEAQRLQEEFLSRVTHDLQSPLAAICSGLELLADKVSSVGGPETAQYIDICMRNSRHLSGMIREILDFSKLDSGKMTVHPAPVSASSLLKEAVESLQPWAKTRKLRLEARSAHADFSVLADQPRVVQVLTNLISNAVKSTKEGGSITVAAVPAAEDGQGIFAVKDTGSGISPEDLGRIFEKFVQVGDGRRDGVGLGLSIVQEFVRLHGGAVWAESEPGKGSVFYFTLPLSQAGVIGPAAQEVLPPSGRPRH